MSFNFLGENNAVMPIGKKNPVTTSECLVSASEKENRFPYIVYGI